MALPALVESGDPSRSEIVQAPVIARRRSDRCEGSALLRNRFDAHDAEKLVKPSALCWRSLSFQAKPATSPVGMEQTLPQSKQASAFNAIADHFADVSIASAKIVSRPTELRQSAALANGHEKSCLKVAAICSSAQST
ncbi:hypothetical protein V1294_006852 [Bradyrhizobium sp. AZCC 1678]|uniref:hypothetical protein n=1 Tax=Bradyrhizobium sp. AZCC 1678 TaxID=3117030 RepID=UPI002FF2DE70